MSTDKNHNQEIKVETNILKFPNCKENQQLADHKKLNEQLINSIATKMAHDKYDQLPLIHEELLLLTCLLYTSPSPRDATLSRMPSSA